MNGITDIHSHIIFQVDDGSDSLETSLEILRREYQQGVTRIILTPHYHIGECTPEQKVIKEHFKQLAEHAKKILPEMKLYLGNEIMACHDMSDLLEQGAVNTLAGTRYVLVEFYPSVQYSLMEQLLKNLLNNGYIPVIAHCERYKCLRSVLKVINAKYIGHLIEMGAYMQVNTASVFGHDSKFASKLIDNDFLHFVASDVHNLGTRGVNWDKCVKHLNKKYNRKYIEQLLIKNPEKLLRGEYI